MTSIVDFTHPVDHAEYPMSIPIDPSFAPTADKHSPAQVVSARALSVIHLAAAK
jgi:hypothetical protein